MVISESFKKDVDLLAQLDPEKNSVALDSNNHLVITEKRSTLRNFFSWFIYTISFHQIPRNRELDRVAKYIFKETLNLTLTDQEKTYLNKALKNLKNVIEKNKGSEGKKIEQLLSTKVKIQSSGPVKNLTGNRSTETEDRRKEGEKSQEETEKPIGLSQNEESTTPLVPQIKEPEPVLPLIQLTDEKRLQEFLQSYCLPGREQKKFDDEAQQKLVELLPQLDGSVDLSQESTDILSIGLSKISKEWVLANAKKLSPNMIRLLVDKSFQGSTYRKIDFVSYLWEALTKEPVDKQKLTALIHGFPAFKAEFRPHGSYEERIRDSTWLQKALPNQQAAYWFSLADDLINKNLLNPQAIAILEKHLSPQDMRLFIHNFFGFVALSSESLKNPRFEHSLGLADSFKPENRAAVLKTLCYSVNPAVLVEVLLRSQPENNLIQTILELNPTEPSDVFFATFSDLLLKEEKQSPKKLSHAIKYILAHASENRKKTLLDKMSNELILTYIADIPSEILDHINYKIKDLAEIARKNPNPSEQHKALQLIAKALEKNNRAHLHQLDDNMDVFFALLPFFSEKTRQNLLGKALRGSTDRSAREKYQRILKEAEKWPTEIWEKASKTTKNLVYTGSIGLLPEKQRVAVINGQIDNKDFCLKFFEEYFKNNDIENQKKFIAFLKPEIFQFDKPHLTDKKIWQQFFKALEASPVDDHMKKLFNISTVHLFNNISPVDKADYIEIITHEQMKQLPLDQLKPEIRLVFSFLTGKLQDQAETLKKLTLNETRAFMAFMKHFYMKEVDNQGQHTYASLIKLTLDLEKIDPSLSSLAIDKIIGDIDIPKVDRTKLISKLPIHIIEAHVVPKAHQLNDEEFYEILERMEPQKARALIDQHLEILTGNALYLRDKIPFSFFLTMIDEATKLKTLLRVPLDANVVGQSSSIRFLPSIFRHLEKYPWKLLLLLDDDQYNSITLHNWITNENDFPNCKALLEQYKPGQNHFTKKDSEDLNNALQQIFTLVKEDKFDEANNIPPMDLKLFAPFIEKATPEQLCDELRYMNEGQIYILSRYANVRPKIQMALDYGTTSKKLSGPTIKRIRELQEAGKQFTI